MDTVTHVAGPVVYFKAITRAIQRCAVCGEKLRDNLNEHGPVGPKGEPPLAFMWTECHFVQVDGNRTTDTGDFREGKLPRDFCLALVE